MGKSLVLNRRSKRPAEDTAAFGAIAERFRRAGALEQAVSLCREGLQKFPDHVSARVTLGWSLLDLGKYDEARAELEQVLRRAPDNLAAIRGLAELHDRFEHTLNLPMDGPGQWPPPPDSVDGTSAEGADQGQAPSGAFQDLAFDDGPSMVPPEMGLPLWTPGADAAEEVDAVANALISPTPASNEILGLRSAPEPAGEAEIQTFARAAAPTVEPPTPLATTPAPTPIPDPEPVLEVAAEVAPEPVAAVAPQPVAEIAPEPIIEVAQAPAIDVEATAAIATDAADELGVTDEDLAALIAEADSLDAAAALEVSADLPELQVGTLEVASAEVDGSVAELEAAVAEFEARTPEAEPQFAVVQFDAGVPEPVTATAEIESTPVELESGSVVFAAAAQELEEAPIELAPPVDVLAEVEPAIELADDLFQLTPPVALIGDLPDEEAQEFEPVETVSGTPLLDAIVEEPEPVEPEVIEPEPEVVEPVAALVETEAVVFEPEPALAAPEPTVVEPVAALVESEPQIHEPATGFVEPVIEIAEPVAAMVEVPEEVRDEVEPVVVAVAAAGAKGAATIKALERLMAQVQARRVQLMAESVA